MRLREAQSSSIAQWCSKSYLDCHAVTEHHTVEWKTSADHAVAELKQTKQRKSIHIFSAEHVKVKQHSKEAQGTEPHIGAESYREQRPHTVVLKASADHAMAEFQRRNTVPKGIATRCCQLPDRGAREPDDHAATQHCVVVLEVPDTFAEW